MIPVESPFRIARLARTAYVLLRLVVGALLLYAGTSKLFEPLAFYQSVLQYRLLPGSASVLAAAVLPWVEVVIGAALLLDVATLGAWLAGWLLFALFTAARAIALLQGTSVARGCAAVPESVTSWQGVALTATLAALAVLGLLGAMVARPRLPCR